MYTSRDSRLERREGWNGSLEEGGSGSLRPLVIAPLHSERMGQRQRIEADYEAVIEAKTSKIERNKSHL